MITKGMDVSAVIPLLLGMAVLLSTSAPPVAASSEADDPQGSDDAGVMADSLRRRLAAVQGAERVRTLRQLARREVQNQPLRAMRHARASLKLAKKLQLPHEEILSLQELGIIAFWRGEPSQAIRHFKEAQTTAASLKDDHQEARALGNLGLIHMQQDRYSEALEYYLQAHARYERLNDDAGVAKILNNLGIIHRRQGNHARALHFFERSARIKRRIVGDVELAPTLTNLGNVHADRGAYAEALRDYRHALSIYLGQSDVRGAAHAHNNIGLALSALGRQKEAREALQRALRLKKQGNNRGTLASTYHALAQTYVETRDHHAALRYGHRSFVVADSVGAHRRRMEASALLARTYATLGNYEKAYAYHRRYSASKDSVWSTDKTKAIARLHARFDVRQKEQEIENLRQESRIQALQMREQRITRNTLIGGLLAAFLLAGLFYNRYRIKQRANRLLQLQKQEIHREKEEKEVLLREIHHRVKNNLQVISSLLGLQAEQLYDPDALDALQEAQSRVQSMTLLHQKLYREDHLAHVDMQEYMEDLADFLLRTVGRSENVRCRVHATDVLLGVDTAMPLGIITNELVLNALEHAFPDGREGVVRVQLCKEEADGYELKVSDNGIGFPDPDQLVEHQSVGMQLIETLTRQLGGDMHVENGAGTTFRVRFTQVEALS